MGRCSCCGAVGRRIDGCSCTGGKSHRCLKGLSPKPFGSSPGDNSQGGDSIPKVVEPAQPAQPVDLVEEGDGGQAPASPVTAAQSTGAEDQSARPSTPLSSPLHGSSGVIEVKIRSPLPSSTLHGSSEVKIQVKIVHKDVKEPEMAEAHPDDGQDQPGSKAGDHIDQPGSEAGDPSSHGFVVI